MGGQCGEVLIRVNAWTVRRDKKVAVVERWRLVEVQLYKILHISARAQTSEVTILSTIFIRHEVYDLQTALW